jgi:hypothetical protein
LKEQFLKLGLNYYSSLAGGNEFVFITSLLKGHIAGQDIVYARFINLSSLECFVRVFWLDEWSQYFIKIEE